MWCVPQKCGQESRTYWFHASSMEDDEDFLLMGIVLGLAVYNSVLLDFPLPLALYRKLLGQSCSLRDLQDMDPQLGNSLNTLLEFDGMNILKGQQRRVQMGETLKA